MKQSRIIGLFFIALMVLSVNVQAIDILLSNVSVTHVNEYEGAVPFTFDQTWFWDGGWTITGGNGSVSGSRFSFYEYNDFPFFAPATNIRVEGNSIRINTNNPAIVINCLWPTGPIPSANIIEFDYTVLSPDPFFPGQYTLSASREDYGYPKATVWTATNMSGQASVAGQIVRFELTQVPEPGSMIMLVAGLLMAFRRNHL